MAKKTKLELAVLSVMATAVIAFVVIAIVILTPFNPLTFHSLSVQEQACPEEAIGSRVSYTIDDNLFSSISSIDVQASWIAEDVPGIPTGKEQIISEITLSQSQLSPGWTIQEGRTLRITPSDPGVWRLKVRDIVRGGLRIQEAEVMAENSTTILGREDPECAGRKP